MDEAMCGCINSVWHSTVTMCVYASRVPYCTLATRSVLPPACSSKVMWKHSIDWTVLLWFLGTQLDIRTLRVHAWLHLSVTIPWNWHLLDQSISILFCFISFFFNLGDPFNALALFFLGALSHIIHWIDI